MTNGQSLKKWRRDERAALLKRRMAVDPQQRKRWNEAIGASLQSVLSNIRANVKNTVIGLYWPFKGEFNTRPLMRQLHADGACPALPAVVEPRAPLEFRRWHPDIEMERGVYGIPIPKDARAVVPTLVIAPLVGFDAAGYRLGYGGGYYDRTLAATDPSPLTIGVGYELSKLETLYPQTHDIAMNMIVTEAGVYDYRSDGT